METNEKIDLVVFYINQEKFAIKTDFVKLVLQTEHVETTPHHHPFVDGIISYKDEVLKVVNFRKILGRSPFESQLKELFIRLQKAHKEWIEELRVAVETQGEFSKTIDPHQCELGAWLDEFNSYDDKISVLLKDLIVKHKFLHRSGGEILQQVHKNHAKAKELFSTQMTQTYRSTMQSLQTFIEEYESISESIQKLVIYEDDKSCFAFKVDGIYDMIHGEESQILPASSDFSNQYIELEGTFEKDDEVIKVIKSFKILK